MAQSFPESILLLGAGRMGAAMLHGWLRAGADPARISVLDPSPSPAIVELAQVHKFALNPWIEALAPVDVAVIAVKPQALDSITPTLAAAVSEQTLVISIVAGQRLGNLAQRLPAPAALVRAMPNLPAEVGRGITTVIAHEGVDARQTGLATKLLSSLGQVEWLDDESLLDAATAVAGSGPAYVFHLVECLSEAGVAAGLPARLADRLARVTVEGSGEMLARSARTPSELRRDVTSPGGTTQAAMDVLLDAGRLQTTLREAVFAAKHRSEELSRISGALCPVHAS